MRISAVIAIIVAIALVVFGFLYLRDTTGPTLTLRPGEGPVSAKREITLTLEDPGAGLKSLTVSAVQGDRAIPLLARQYPPGSHQARESFRLPPTGLKEGPLKLRIAATDRALFHFGAGNTTEQSLSFEYQNKPPAVRTAATNANCPISTPRLKNSSATGIAC